MSALPGFAIQFHCHLDSPFHTRRQEYTNLWKCAPYILGSTLRGALLTHLITTHYGQTDIDSLAFQKNGPCAPFFTDPQRVFFSFGEFDQAIDERMEALARITLERENGSVAEGALLSLEAVPAGAKFSFEVLVIGEDGALNDAIQNGVKEMSMSIGIGGLRSLGMGRFSVESAQCIPLSERLADVEKHLSLVDGTKPLKIEFTTPYILTNGQDAWDGRPETLARKIETEVASVAEETGLDERVVVQDVNTRLKPDFVSRWSYELGLRESRMVTWPGSQLDLTLDPPGITRELLARLMVFGLGEWRQWGFGRFRMV